MKVQILGKGCPKCRHLEKNVRDAVGELDAEVDIEKITDPDRIMNMGVMITPGLLVDGRILSMGKVPTKRQIMDLLRKG